MLVIAGCLARGAAAANLVPDPGFDQQDLSRWVPSNLAFAEWSLVDERGIPSSGSMRLFTSGLSSNHVRLCVPVVAGTSYAFGASARIPSSPRIDHVAHTAVQWWSSIACGGSELEPGSAAGSVAARLRGDWGTTEGWGTAPPGAQSASLLLLSTASTTDGFEVLFDNAFFVENATCVPTFTALCLNRGRFLFTAEWSTRHDAGGYGRAVPITDDSGAVWFFEGENVEVVVKLLDACSTSFQRYWFFAAGLTDVATTLRVYDTRGGAIRTYTTHLEEPFVPIQDTAAFATCP
jgi:hypothetical protein